jgi:hypothetical protein
MKKKIIKTVFVVVMALVVTTLSYKIFVIEKRRAAIAEQIAKIETLEKQLEKQRSKMVIPSDGSLPLPPPSAPPPTVIQVSPSDGLRVELNDTTSWNTILQLIFTLLASYLGIKLINKHVRD